MIAWNAVLAASLAVGITLALLGRSLPVQASLPWAVTWALFFLAAFTWLSAFARRATRAGAASPSGREIAAMEAPLMVLSVGGDLAIYLSDDINHLISFFLLPTPAVLLLLAAAATAVFQEAFLAGSSPRHPAEWLRTAVTTSGRWVVPASLLILGLLQGTAYLWVIGNDFTRYWAIADGISTNAGYIVSVNQGNYIEGGMYRYSVEFPIFPLLLITSFALVGHDTLGAHLPALAANTLLPLILFAFYRKAGLPRPSAYGAACLVALFPFLRLYTLNAPVPDAVFMALLVSAGFAYLHLIPTFRGWFDEKSVETAAAVSRAGTHRYLPWIAFGVAAGLAALGRPEGLVFIVMMFLGLVPFAFRAVPYISGFIFLAFVAPFSLVIWSTLGIPWPRNAGSSFGLDGIPGNLDWIQRRSLEQFANAAGVSRGEFVVLVSVLALAILASTLWLAKHRWQLALLPGATLIHTFLVFAVDPRVSGADQWFDFFRHLSYGLPFAFLPLFLAGQRAESLLKKVMAGNSASAGIPILAAILLAISVYQLYLLAYPSLTHPGGRQLLTSDVWVSFHSILNNRYQLPVLPFTRQEGVMMIDPAFEYIPRHLESIKQFFEPYSVLNTGNGTQYEFSALLVMLFGGLFAPGGALWPGRASAGKGRAESSAGRGKEEAGSALRR